MTCTALNLKKIFNPQSPDVLTNQKEANKGKYSFYSFYLFILSAGLFVKLQRLLLVIMEKFYS
jgi:hypothetical protein